MVCEFRNESNNLGTIRKEQDSVGTKFVSFLVTLEEIYDGSGETTILLGTILPTPLLPPPVAKERVSLQSPEMPWHKHRIALKSGFYLEVNFAFYFLIFP